MSNSPRTLASSPSTLIDLRVDKKIDNSTLEAIIPYNKR